MSKSASPHLRALERDVARGVEKGDASGLARCNRMAQDARMCRITSGLVLGIAGIFFIVVQVSAGGQEPSVSVPEGWIELPAEGATTASAFVVVKNPTMYDIYLVSAASDVAGKVEFRGADGDGARTLPDVTVPAYGTVRMKADGVHLQLMGVASRDESGGGRGSDAWV